VIHLVDVFDLHFAPADPPAESATFLDTRLAAR
jgi:hypothetical protein